MIEGGRIAGDDISVELDEDRGPLAMIRQMIYSREEQIRWENLYWFTAQVRLDRNKTQAASSL